MLSVLGAEKLNLTEIEAFLSASESVRFALRSRGEVYGWSQRAVVRVCSQDDRTEQAQTTRLIAAYLKAVRIAPQPSRRPHFARRYTRPTSLCWPPSMKPTSD